MWMQGNSSACTWMHVLTSDYKWSKENAWILKKGVWRKGKQGKRMKFKKKGRLKVNGIEYKWIQVNANVILEILSGCQLKQNNTSISHLEQVNNSKCKWMHVKENECKWSM
jgi:hypothetical protein